MVRSLETGTVLNESLYIYITRARPPVTATEQLAAYPAGSHPAGPAPAGWAPVGVTVDDDSLAHILTFTRMAPV